MGFQSAIEWTETTWNPWQGCHKVSPGCKNCYMFRDKKRYGQEPNTVVRSHDKTFYAPLKWQEPRQIFTCSWSDFFIEEADAWRDEAFAIMSLTPQHTYQVLTKRPQRMLEYLDDCNWEPRIYDAVAQLARKMGWKKWPDDGRFIMRTEPLEFLPNVWLGVSVEDQKTADERIPLLLKTPAALRWLSMEPLLGPVDLSNVRYRNPDFDESDLITMDVLRGIVEMHDTMSSSAVDDCDAIDWIVTGGESGPESRPTHPDWYRSIRDQCGKAEVPFFFKQWGEWYGGPSRNGDSGPFRICRGGRVEGTDYPTHPEYFFMFGADTVVQKVGKKKAGRLLDGREWNETPATR